MVDLRKMAKNILTFFRYPVVSIRLMHSGASNLYIGPGMQLNSRKKFHVGKNVYIGKDSRFMLVGEYHGGAYEPSVSIGSNISIGNRFTVLSAAPVNISDNCLIASDVMISSENHGTNPEISESYSDIPLTASPVTLGKGCWIGEKVSILPGVTLGDRCIVGTNSVVTHSYPAYCMLVGIPAKVIKKYNFEKHEWEKVRANE